LGYRPPGRYFEEFQVGETFTTAARTVTEADVVLFAGLSGDFNPVHTDEVTMRNSPFGGRIAHGMLVASIATGLANRLGIFEGTTVALLEMNLRWTAPVKPGDTVHAVLEVTDKRETRHPDRGIVTLQVRVCNQEDACVMESSWKVMLRRR